MIDEVRDARQKLGISIWGQNGYKGILNYTYRFGKTRVIQKAIDFINDNTNSEITPYIVIGAPNDTTVTNLKNNLSGLNFDVYSMQKLSNLLESNTLNCTCLILDEVHKWTCTTGVRCLSNVKCGMILGLTGVKIDSQKKLLLSQFGLNIIDVISESEALLKGWISNYDEYNLALQFADDEKVAYERYSKAIKESLSMYRGVYHSVNNALKSDFDDEGLVLLTSDLDFLISMVSGKMLRHASDMSFKPKYLKGELLRAIAAKVMGWSASLDLTLAVNRQKDLYWNPDNIESRAKQFKDLIGYRTELINNNRAKLNTVLDICDTNPVATIIFNESTIMADRIADALNGMGYPAICYHSNIDSRTMLDESGKTIMTKTKNPIPKMFGKISLKKMAIEGMLSGKYKFLVTAKALDEGLNIPNLMQSITTSGSANPIQYSQRNARTKTIDEANVNKVSTIINLYMDDFINSNNELIESRDKQKLMTRQSNSFNEINEVSSIDEIKFTF